ncbi:hypothetical protein BDF21DRAFT_417130 [Thamnidium elegans]|uniref:F-box domain-containing protein n=1 Tax=Thamnidium elegans TaxID=101142 RepID=A0A8H7SFP7_9FUNG|nr:hypothetical protein INT48_007316 [Thamnidium elegans]KAI8082101.1 hypothetical protein BDF21DRAFT_417130 [Thamnidium elegans]
MLLGPQNLPTEILEDILLYLPHSTLYQCIYVCKLWSSSASVLFYKELHIENNIPGIIDLSHPIYRYKNTIEKLVITEIKTNFSQEKHFVQSVLCNFSNLKVLDFSDSPFLFGKIFGLLLSHDFHMNLPRIQEIIVRKHPEVPTEISLLYEAIIGCHVNLCQQFHQTITRITFSDMTLERWMKCIHTYTKLTHLTIHNNYAFRIPKAYDESLMAFFLCQCPSLVEFTVLNSFYLPDNYDEFPRDTRKLCIQVYEHEYLHDISNERVPDYLPSTPHFNLTTLSLVLPTINTSQMKYIVSHIPSLKRFKLRLTRTNIHTWLDQNCQTTILQFANHLSLIKDLVFTMSVLSSSVTIESISPIIHRQTNLLCTFLNTLKGPSRKLRSSHTRFHLFFKQRRPINKSTNFSFQIANDQHLYFEYAIAYIDFMFRNHTNLSSPFLVDISPIVMVGQKKELDIIVTNNEPNGVVKYALANFSHIDILKIYTHQLNEPESEIDCQYIAKYVREYGVASAHIRDLSRLSKDFFPDIRVLTIESDRLDDEPIVPKLKHLLGRFYSNPSERVEPQGTFLLDLTDHKHLQELHLSVPSIYEREYLILIKLKNMTDSYENRTSFHTYQSISGDYVQVENDIRLKRGASIPLLYTIIFHIKTVSDITFSIF